MVIDIRCNKLKINEIQFKQYLLDHYIDDKGMKVSDRVVWDNDNFFELTGMYTINKFTGDRQMLSTGTISYWKKKLNVKERDVYNYHVTYTKRIPKETTYSEWSRKNNKGYPKETTFNRETTKRKLIKFAGLPQKYNHKSLDELILLVLKTWETLGLDAEGEMKRFYMGMRRC